MHARPWLTSHMQISDLEQSSNRLVQILKPKGSPNAVIIVVRPTRRKGGQRSGFGTTKSERGMVNRVPLKGRATVARITFFPPCRPQFYTTPSRPGPPRSRPAKTLNGNGGFPLTFSRWEVSSTLAPLHTPLVCPFPIISLWWCSGALCARCDNKEVCVPVKLVWTLVGRRLFVIKKSHAHGLLVLTPYRLLQCSYEPNLSIN